MHAHPTYAVIGDPVAHSLSPRLFALAFERLGMDARYEALRTRPGELTGVLRRVRAGELAGLSVTLPHKVAVTRLLDGLDPQASRIGAVNCVRASDRVLTGHNTDLVGIVRTLHQHLGGHPTHKQVLILGAGGAARAATVAMAQLSAEVVIVNRTLARAKEVAARVEHGQALALADDDAMRAACRRADLVINATSVGLQSGDCPLPPSCPLRSGQVVLDLVYRPLETALLARAREARATAIDGLWVLVHQALFQLSLWTGHGADDALAAELHRALTAEAP